MTLPNVLHVAMLYDFATCRLYAIDMEKTVRLNPYGGHMTLSNGIRMTMSYNSATCRPYVNHMDNASKIKTTWIPYDSVSGVQNPDWKYFTCGR